MSVALVLAAAILTTAPAAQVRYDARPGSALSALNRIAAQGGVDIVVTADLAHRTTPGVSGAVSVESAFDRILAPLGARAVRLEPGLYRIEAAAPRASVPIAASPSPTELEAVIVTAPVRRGGLAEASGRLVAEAEQIEGAASASGTSSDVLANLTATIDSTRQGSGRNKLFVRGLADSAFNGPLQSTIGQYLGELRLNYGSPDPDLLLTDIDGIDVFEGPQGTRFGAGSVGGVVRIRPAPPDPAVRSGRLSAGASDVSIGSAGADLGLVLNMPLSGEVAARLVGYARRDGGFLNNPTRGADRQDGVDTIGGRGGLRLFRDGWTIDVQGVAQRIRSRDAQTVSVGGEARLDKTRGIAEPYDSTLFLAGLTASRRATGWRFTSATSLSRQELTERFDATGPFGMDPAVVDRAQSTWALSSELRAATERSGRLNGSIGAAVVVGETTAERRRLSLTQVIPVYGSNLDRSFAEAAVFGESVLTVTPRLRIAAGGRLSAVRVVYDVSSTTSTAVAGMALDDGVALNLNPSLGLEWSAPGGALVFARLDRAIRPGGVNEDFGDFQAYRPDVVTLTEAGVKLARSSAADSLTAQASVGWIDWRDIQADTATQGGDLVTGNVGDGRILFATVRAGWSPTPTLDLSASLFLNESRLRIDQPNIIGITEGDIPNVAPVGAQASLIAEAGRPFGLPLSLEVDLRYVGRSRIGLGPGLDAPQGGYLRTDLGLRLGTEERRVSLGVSNLFDVRAVRYGIGSPYQLYDPQAVPLQPLTARLGFEIAF